MAIKNKYCSTFPSIKYLFGNGKEAIFVGGVYLTDVPWEIEQLDSEVQQGHPHIYVDAANLTTDSDGADPLEIIRRKAVADYIAAQKVASDPTTYRGTSDNGTGFSGATTATLSEAAMSSDEGVGAAIAAAQAVPVKPADGGALAALKAKVAAV